MNPTIQAFHTQSQACGSLGSPFMADLCKSIAENIDGSTVLGALCLNWKGDPSPSADSVPLRLCGGLHALVISGKDDQLAKNYPPHSKVSPSWEQVKAALVKHEAFFIKWMQSPPQTNEVARSGVIWPVLMEIASRIKMPLRLLEVGASGGLNLNQDKYEYAILEDSCGELGSRLKLEPEWKGKLPTFHPVEIDSRIACDLSPLNVLDDGDALRLRSYVWPDQLDRTERLNAALSIAKDHPVSVEKADAVEWLGEYLKTLPKDVCTVIYSTIAWQYLPEDARAEGDKLIEDAGKLLSSNHSPLALIRFEADGQTPGAAISLSMWPNRSKVQLGRADFHGRWIDWSGS